MIIWLIELRVVKDKANIALRMNKFLELEKDKVSFIGLLVKVGIEDVTKDIDR